MWRRKVCGCGENKTAVQQCSNARSEAQGTFSRQEKVLRRIAVTSINCKVRQAHDPKSLRGFSKESCANDEAHEKEGEMPHAVTSDNIRLYFEEAGSGTPILFLHE